MNAVRGLLRDLRLRGVVLARDGDRVRVDAPVGAVRPTDRKQLAEAKQEVADALATEGRLLGLSCWEFERQEAAIEFRLEAIVETLWLVPRVEHLQRLVGEGVRRGRIWTAHEMAELLSLPQLTRDDFVRLARLKVAFGAQVVSVSPDAPTEQQDG